MPSLSGADLGPFGQCPWPSDFPKHNASRRVNTQSKGSKHSRTVGSGPVVWVWISATCRGRHCCGPQFANGETGSQGSLSRDTQEVLELVVPVQTALHPHPILTPLDNVFQATQILNIIVLF